MNWLGVYLQRHIGESDTILDLGCGIMGATDDLKCKSILGCDVFPVYLDKIKTIHPTVVVNMNELERFMDESYDVVLCLDVVEHLEKELELKVLDECKRICRRLAIVFTPAIFSENNQPPEGAWGLGENHLQKHICLITRHDLRTRRYKIFDHDNMFIAIYDVNGS